MNPRIELVQTNSFGSWALSDSAKKSLSSPSSLLQGIQTVTGETAPQSLFEGKFAPVGGVASCYYIIVEDIDSLSRTLDISASASVGMGLWSGSIKTSFVSKLSLTTYSLSIVVRAFHGKTSEPVNYKEKPGIHHPKTKEQFDEFYSTYGDSFVTSITTGAEYIAVYTFHTQSREEQNSLSLALSAAGITTSGSVNADLQLKLDTVTKSTQTRTEFNQIVFGIENPAMPTPDDLISFALKFSTIPVDASSTIRFSYSGYEEKVQWLKNGFKPLVKNRELFLGNSGTDRGLESQYNEIVLVLNQINWINSVYSFYGSFRDKKLEDVEILAHADLTKIENAIRAFEASPFVAIEHFEIPSLGFGFPTIQTSINRTPLAGHDDGGEFYYTGLDSYISSKTRISELQVRTGSLVDALWVTYEICSKNPVQSSRPMYGGPGGDVNTPPLDIPLGQFLRQYRGRAGSAINSLVLTRSDGLSINGEGRDHGGGDYGWDCPSDTFILAFYGSVNRVLNQIGVIYANFQPASWNAVRSKSYTQSRVLRNSKF